MSYKDVMPQGVNMWTLCECPLTGVVYLRHTIEPDECLILPYMGGIIDPESHYGDTRFLEYSDLSGFVPWVIELTSPGCDKYFDNEDRELRALPEWAVKHLPKA